MKIRLYKSKVGDNHLFINDSHDPTLCPECIRPGALAEVDLLETAKTLVPLFDTEIVDEDGDKGYGWVQERGRQRSST